MVSKPRSAITRRLTGSTSATSTLVQPRMRSHCAASAPIGPAPITSAVPLAGTCSLSTACSATAAGSTIAACSSGIDAGTGIRLRSGTYSSSAIPPSRREPK